MDERIISSDDGFVNIGDTEVEVYNGEITLNIENDEIISIAGLDVGDSFSLNYTNYAVTELGLVMQSEEISKLYNYEIAEEISLDEFYNEDNWIQMLAVYDGALDLGYVEYGSAVIVDDPVNPTMRIGDVSAYDGEYTVVSDGDFIQAIYLGNNYDYQSITTDFNTTVVTPEGSNGTYVVNYVEYVAADSALTIRTDYDYSWLESGTVRVTYSLGTAESFIDVENDDDGVLVSVVEGMVTSITGLSDGGVVRYNEQTYEMIGAVLKVRYWDWDEEYFLYPNVSEDFNLLDFDEGYGERLIYLPITEGVLNLAAGR